MIIMMIIIIIIIIIIIKIFIQANHFSYETAINVGPVK